MNNLDLTVVILSFNTKDITGRCLGKLKIAKDYCEDKLKNRVQVIVLDNGSSDGSAQTIKSDCPWVKLIVSKINLGFSKGNNVVIKQSKSPYILLLNSDCYVAEDSIYKTLAYFRVNLNCDVLGARLNYGSGALQPSAGNLPTPINIISWIFGLSLFTPINFLIPPFHPKDKKYFSKAHRTGWIMGAFFALKRKVYEKSSGFDENLFMYMEEVEWCKRINKSGFKVWFVPSVEVIHLHGASSKFDLQSSFLNELKGIKYYLNKHYKHLYLFVKLFLMIGLILRIIAFSILRKNNRAKVYIQGLSVV